MWKKSSKEGSLTQPIPSGWKIVDLGLLGEGGMSQVFRVRDAVLDRDVALKVLRPDLARAPEALERFIDEAKITAQLDHPNIPPVYALASERRKSSCFTMKVLEGKTLQEILEVGDKGSATTDSNRLFVALEVLTRVCDAVAFAHSRGIVHCDLKPHNVMVGEHGQIYVVDWGLARRMRDLPSPEEGDNSVHGTPAYMAPEQARGQNDLIDQRTDIFALGGILFRILTGRPPYAAKTTESAHKLAKKGKVGAPEFLAREGLGGSRRLAAICMRALAADPDERYQTVAEFRREVDDFVRGTARLPEQHFKAGEDIIREGEAGDSAYIILDGHCQVSRVVGGKTQQLRLLGPGEMFGETAVFTGSPRIATITALIDTTVAVVDQVYLQEEMKRTSLMALAVRAVASSFLELNGQTAALLQEKSAFTAVELVLKELALRGRPGAEQGRWLPWAALLKSVAEKTGLPHEMLAARVSRVPGIRIDAAANRLFLSSKG